MACGRVERLIDRRSDHVESGQDFSSLFSVSYDGILTIDEPVDMEVADMFTVVVVAVDRGNDDAFVLTIYL